MWKEVAEFPGYFVNEAGQVKGPRGWILKPSKTKDGYLLVSAYKDGKHYTQKVHRLVALAFIDNPDNKRETNHKNGVKADNRVDNLEWATGSENSQHAYNTGLHSHITPVIATHAKTGEQIYFASTREAERGGFNSGGIWSALKGRKKTHGGYRWEYAT